MAHPIPLTLQTDEGPFRTGALHRTNQKVSLLPTRLMCVSGKQAPSFLDSQPSPPRVPVWIPQIRGLSTAVCQKQQALYFLAVFVSSSCYRPSGDSDVLGFSSWGFVVLVFLLFWRVCCVFVDPHGPGLDCNGTTYLKTLRDLRCI